MDPNHGGIEAHFILGIVERAILRVPRSSHHGLTKVPTATRIAGRTHLDLALLENIDATQLPEVVLAARLYHLAYTHRAMVIIGQCALWAHGDPSDPPLPPITVASSLPSAPIRLPAVTVGTHRFPSVTVKPRHVRRLPSAENAGGIFLETPQSAQVTIARTSPNPRSAFVQLCMIGHEFTHFDNFHLTNSRLNEKRCCTRSSPISERAPAGARKLAG